MADIWSNLGKSQLQDLIGVELLGRLERLLPALDATTVPDNIHTSQGLSAVFDSFSGASRLELPEFRALLFDALPPELMARLLDAVGQPAEGLGWPQKVDALVGAWKDHAAAEVMVGILGISRDFLPQQASLPPDTLLLAPAGNPYKPLKNFQVPVCSASMLKLAAPLSRFVIQMPTGSGKTRTAIEVITQVLNEQPDGTVVVWLAHSEELCEQAYDCFAEVWSHVARRPLRLIRSWGQGASLPFDFSESGFMVGGFAKLFRRLQKSKGSFSALAPRVYLLVVDEAHKILAPTYMQVTKALMGEQTRVMGLTATPGRSVDSGGGNEALAEFFFKELVGLDGGKDGVLEMLRKNRVLAETEYIRLETSPTFQLSAKEKEHLAKFFDLPPAVLARLAGDDIRNIEIVRRLQAECRRGGQILFFGCSVEHSKFICALLNFLKIKAVHLDGATNRARRQALVEDFRTQKVQVLCNYALLSTGFDAPKTDVVFIARPTGSIVLYSQMIGRGLRGPAIGGTEKCRIVDVVDNIQGFSDEDRVYNYFEGYFSPGSLA
jgi:DNA repair protein RadD